MKTRFLFVGAALMFISLVSSGQSSGQLRAGLNLANISITDNGKVDEAKSLTSFQIGFIGDIPLAGSVLSFQPGIVFTGKGTKTEIGNPSSNFYSKATTNPYYIEVPLSLVAKLPLGGYSKFFVGGGAYGAIGIAGKTKIENTSPLGIQKYEESITFSNDDPTTLDYEEGAGFGILKRFDYGLNGMAGIEGKSVVLSINYGLGLAKLQSGADNSDDKNKHRVLSITLGFKL